MRFLKLSLVLALGYAGPIYASGGGGGEGGSEAAAAAVPKEQKEFTEKSAKLATLTNKIVESEKHFNELVHHKNALKDPIEKQKIIHEMVTAADQRNKDVEAYNSLKSELAMRYPNQGEQLKRRYQTMDKRSVEELEGAAGLDEMLNVTKKMVERKYAPFLEKEDKPGAGPRKPSAVAPPVEEPKRLRLEK